MNKMVGAQLVSRPIKIGLTKGDGGAPLEPPPLKAKPVIQIETRWRKNIHPFG